MAATKPEATCGRCKCVLTVEQRKDDLLVTITAGQAPDAGRVRYKWSIPKDEKGKFPTDVRVGRECGCECTSVPHLEGGAPVWIKP